MNSNSESEDFFLDEIIANFDFSLAQVFEEDALPVLDQLLPVPTQGTGPSNGVFAQAHEERVAAHQEALTEPIRDPKKRAGSGNEPSRQRLSEKRRLKKIAEHMETLRKLTPNCPPELSREKTLQRIIEHIHNLQLQAQFYHMRNQAAQAWQMANYNSQAYAPYNPYAPYNTGLNYYPLGFPTPLPHNPFLFSPRNLGGESSNAPNPPAQPNQQDPNNLLGFPPRNT